MVLSETLYLIFIGAISAIIAWIIISAFKYIYRITKQFTIDFNQMKSDMKEIKAKIKSLENKIGDSNE